MINRILSRFRFLLLKRNIQSLDQLKQIKPFDQLDSNVIELNKEILRPYYQQYINEISRADMAASLELAAFMFTLCKINRYTKLLDMGSGLSSFVFRLYAKDNPDVRVFSVDDDSAWLEKTKDFLRLHQLSTENIFTLDQFIKSSENEFDCILHDLNFVEVRINYVEQMINRTKSKGLIIFDDVHKPDYLFALLTKLKNKGLSVFDLKPTTFDIYKRFALAAVKD